MREKERPEFLFKSSALAWAATHHPSEAMELSEPLRSRSPVPIRRRSSEAGTNGEGPSGRHRRPLVTIGTVGGHWRSLVAIGAHWQPLAAFSGHWHRWCLLGRVVGRRADRRIRHVLGRPLVQHDPRLEVAVMARVACGAHLCINNPRSLHMLF
jgi:hypothetical protein